MSMVRIVRPTRRRKATLTSAQIAGRLLDLELATVAAVRSLQMDLTGEAGVPAEEALRDARRALKR
jgi:hypothetical protein